MAIVRGSITTHNVTVDVSVAECFAAVETAAWSRLGGKRRPRSSHGGATYINNNGTWETWENTHGSGHTEEHEPATEAEKALDAALTLVKKAM